MLHSIKYKNLEEVLSYFINFLPEPKRDGIASISKYAKVNDEDVTVRAVKRRVCTGFTWSFEVTVGASI